MFQQLQKVCREYVCSIKTFRANYENLDKVSFASQKIACSYTYTAQHDLDKLID